MMPLFLCARRPHRNEGRGDQGGGKDKPPHPPRQQHLRLPQPPEEEPTTPTTTTATARLFTLHLTPSVSDGVCRRYNHTLVVRLRVEHEDRATVAFSRFATADETFACVDAPRIARRRRAEPDAALPTTPAQPRGPLLSMQEN